jgi:hypothetical protein
MQTSFNTLAIVAGVFSFIIIIIILIAYKLKKKKQTPTNDAVPETAQSPAPKPKQTPITRSNESEEPAEEPIEEPIEEPAPVPVPDLDKKPTEEPALGQSPAPKPDPVPDIAKVPDLAKDLDNIPTEVPVPVPVPAEEHAKDEVPVPDPVPIPTKQTKKNKSKKWKTLQFPTRISNQKTRYSANIDDIKKGGDKVQIYRFDTKEIYSLKQKDILKDYIDKYNELYTKKNQAFNPTNMYNNEIDQITDQIFSLLLKPENLPENYKKPYVQEAVLKQNELENVKGFIKEFQKDSQSISDMDKVYHNNINCFVKMRVWEKTKLTYKYHLLVVPSTEEHAKPLQEIVKVIQQPEYPQAILDNWLKQDQDFVTLNLQDGSQLHYNQYFDQIKQFNNIFKDVFDNHKHSCENKKFTKWTENCETSLVCSKAFPTTYFTENITPSTILIPNSSKIAGYNFIIPQKTVWYE